jgi:hypothetical protein
MSRTWHALHESFTYLWHFVGLSRWLGGLLGLLLNARRARSSRWAGLGNIIYDYRVLRIYGIDVLSKFIKTLFLSVFA